MKSYEMWGKIDESLSKPSTSIDKVYYKVSKLYGNGSNDSKKERYCEEKARVAARNYLVIANYLRAEGFKVGKVIQSRYYPSWSSSENYSLGEIEIPRLSLDDSIDRILNLSGLSEYGLAITEGWEEKPVGERKGIHSLNLKNLDSFLQFYQERWGRGSDPDWVVLSGVDSESDGRISIKVGNFKEERMTLKEKISSFLGGPKRVFLM